VQPTALAVVSVRRMGSSTYERSGTRPWLVSRLARLMPGSIAAGLQLCLGLPLGALGIRLI